MRKNWIVWGYLLLCGTASQMWAAEKQSPAEEWAQVQAELTALRQSFVYSPNHPQVSIAADAPEDAFPAATKAVWQPYMQQVLQTVSPLTRDLLQPGLALEEFWSRRMSHAFSESVCSITNEICIFNVDGNAAGGLLDFIEFHALQTYLQKVKVDATVPARVKQEIEHQIETLRNTVYFAPFQMLPADEDEALGE